MTYTRVHLAVDHLVSFYLRETLPGMPDYSATANSARGWRSMALSMNNNFRSNTLAPRGEQGGECHLIDYSVDSV